MYLNLNPEIGHLYLQVYSAIRDMIISRELKDGTKLPSIRSLSSEYSISKNTVSNAYYQLEIEGYISSVEKVGFFVNKIDHLVQLDSDSEESTPISEIKPIYDFSFSGVDSSSFPYSIWRRVFRETVNSEDETLLRQGDPKGLYELRDAIANYLKNSRGVSTSPDDIIISAGTEHLFYLLRRLLGENSKYGFEDPGYAWGNEFFTYDLKSAAPIPIDESGIKISDLVREDVDICLVTPAHQFPTGIVMPISRRIELLNWAAVENRFIIEDDYDGEFKFSGRPVPALKSMDVFDSVIYMGSFSKCLTPSLRISYMVMPKKLMRLYENAFSGFGCPCSVFIQKALTTFIKDGYFEKHINRMRNIYSGKHELMTGLLGKINGLKIIPPQSGMSFVIELKKDIDGESFAEYARKNGIGITPLNRFSTIEENSNPKFIIGFAGLSKSEIKTGLSALKDLINRI
ncbi:PLP-dependent aminotransferase family protein [Microaceticoccus formicicus]|uniref:MocR-like pyridoxine biosynthesis transcription factor PdxR n=1 Tax=Microaceticoccus formicicus TaxID=3118105 RepID=UPI003CD01C01|nr:PLP-dependent aminotransferase family protein [Peptoniphilaceae bacterium AMB_02]